MDLPAGIDVGVLSMGPHLDANVFADAGRFDPSRMLEAVHQQGPVGRGTKGIITHTQGVREAS